MLEKCIRKAWNNPWIRSGLIAIAGLGAIMYVNATKPEERNRLIELDTSGRLTRSVEITGAYNWKRGNESEIYRVGHGTIRYNRLTGQVLSFNPDNPNFQWVQNPDQISDLGLIPGAQPLPEECGAFGGKTEGFVDSSVVTNIISRDTKLGERVNEYLAELAEERAGRVYLRGNILDTLTGLSQK